MNKNERYIMWGAIILLIFLFWKYVNCHCASITPIKPVPTK